MRPDKLVERSLATSPEITRAYAELSEDHNPLHIDPAFAAGTAFGGPIAHGAMALNLLLEAIDATEGLDGWAAGLDIRFSAPVRVGETITAGGQIAAPGARGYDVWVVTGTGETVLRGTLRLGPDA